MKRAMYSIEDISQPCYVINEPHVSTNRQSQLHAARKYINIDMGHF